jgi:hypothetical protein
VPRRKEMTLSSLRFEWGPNGTVASPRQEARSRPMAYELGRALLALETAARPHRAAHVSGDMASSLPIVEIARGAGLSEHDARAALHDLLPTGCIVRRRVRLGRQRDFARWAHGFQLAPEREVHGPGRRPRLAELALVVESSLPCGDLLDVLLRRSGMLSAQAVTIEEALRLLACIGFDLVVLDDACATELSHMQSLASATQRAGCGPMMLLSAAGAGRQPYYPAQTRLVLAKPFAPRQFVDAISGMGVGIPTAEAAMHGIGA